MEETAKLIKGIRPSVTRLAFFQGSEEVGGGSGFLSANKLISNSHVIQGGGPFDAVEITFGDQDTNPITPIRLAREEFYGRIVDESGEQHSDYVVCDLSAEPEFAERPNLELARADDLAYVGERVLFLGFPFLGSHVTAHLGYISADYRSQGVHRLQIDGSINRGNSGGPLIHLESGKVIGIVTRSEPGLDKHFDDLIEAIGKNIASLPERGGISIGGVDPVHATRVTMTILGRISTSIKRSANVGIGWAYCVEHLLDSGNF